MLAFGGVGNGTSVGVSGVSYGGVTAGWAALIAARFDTNYTTASAWYKNGGLATGTTSCVITFANNTEQEFGAAVSVTGHNTSTPLGTAAANHAGSGGGSTASVNVASDSGDLVIGVCTSDSSTQTPAGSQVEEQENVGSDTSYNVQTAAGQTTSTTLSWTITSGNSWAAIGVAIKPAAGGSGSDVYASGVATSTAASVSTAAVEFSSSGAAVATAAGSSENTSELSAVGTGAGNFSPAGSAQADIYASGAATATADSVSTAQGDLSTAGAATATLVPGGTADGALSAGGVSVGVVAGIGGTEASGALSAAGAATTAAVALSPETRFLQAASAFDGSSPGVVTFGASVTLESALVLGMRIGSTSVGVSSITDTAGNTWKPVDISQNQTTDGHQVRVYHVDGAREGSTEVTVLLDGAASLRLVAAEYTRVGIVDKTAGAQGSTAAPASGATAQTTVREELVVGVVTTQDAATFTAGSGYYKRAEAGSRLALADKTVANRDTFNVDWSLGGADEWAAVAVTYMDSDPTLAAAGQATAIGVSATTFVEAAGYSRASSPFIVQEIEGVVGASGYDVGYDTNSGDPYATVVDVGDVESYTIGPLTGGTYYVNVRAYDSGGNRGPWGTESVYQISTRAVGDAGPQASADGSTAASSAATWTGRSTADVALLAAGQSTPDAVSSQESYGTSNAAADAQAVSDSQVAVPAYAAGASTAAATAQTQASAEITSSASAGATMSGAGLTGSETIASSGASATATGDGAALSYGEMIAAGAAVAQAEASSTVTADGRSAGVAIAQADSGIEVERVAAGGRPPKRVNDDEELMMLLEDYIFPLVLGPPADSKEIVIYDRDV